MGILSNIICLVRILLGFLLVKNLIFYFYDFESIGFDFYYYMIVEEIV